MMSLIVIPTKVLETQMGRVAGNSEFRIPNSEFDLDLRWMGVLLWA